MTAKPLQGQVSRSVQRSLLAFAAIACVGVALVVYIALANTEITVTRATSDVTTTALVAVRPVGQAPSSGELNGVLVVREATGTATQVIENTTSTVEGKANGTVTLTNTWSQVQPLAATTRLLSRDGVLFRTLARVDVPARGSVDVDVEADRDGTSGDIGPSTFTIPGLSAELQAKITGTSAAPMTGGIRHVATVRDADVAAALASAQDAAEESLDGKPLANLPESYGLIDGLIAKPTVTQRRTSSAVGEQADTVGATVDIRSRALAFDQVAVEVLARAELDRTLPQGFELTDGPLEYELMSQDLQGTSDDFQGATVQFRVAGSMQPSATFSGFAPAALTRKSLGDLEAKLVDQGFATRISVRFSPFWVRHSSPLADHIHVRFDDESR